MTLLWIEGFESFGTTNGVAPDDLGTKYPDVSQQSNTDIEAGRIGGKSWETGNGSAWITTPGLGSLTTVIMGVGFRYAIPLAATRLITFYEPTIGALTLNIRLGLTGLLSAYRGNTHLGTSVTGMSADTWAYIEIKAVNHNSTGSVEIKLNGTAILTLTNIDTNAGEGEWGQFNLRGAGTFNLYTFDDWYICDNSGSVNNDFLGNSRVDAVFADGAGANSAWTPSAGSNWQNVDDNPSDDDTTYNSSGTSTDTDTHTYEAMPSVGTIAGLQINTIARLTDASAFNLETVIISNVTTSNDVGQAVPGGYGNIHRIAEQDPDTAAAWTESGVNAAEFGYEIE